jgi:hypothetical protein
LTGDVRVGSVGLSYEDGGQTMVSGATKEKGSDGAVRAQEQQENRDKTFHVTLPNQT